VHSRRVQITAALFAIDVSNGRGQCVGKQPQARFGAQLRLNRALTARALLGQSVLSALHLPGAPAYQPLRLGCLAGGCADRRKQHTGEKRYPLELEQRVINRRQEHQSQQDGKRGADKRHELAHIRSGTPLQAVGCG
jgi:hypothetical protein